MVQRISLAPIRGWTSNDRDESEGGGGGLLLRENDAASNERLFASFNIFFMLTSGMTIFSAFDRFICTLGSF